MSLWSIKRRFIYGGTTVLFLLIVLVLVFWNLFYKAPTCKDGIKNGTESGVDCGGSCKNLCTADTLKPVVLWSKVFNISGDIYSAVAYVENPNVNSKNSKAEYEFKIYDENKSLILIKAGSTSISKNKKFAVFETGILAKNSKPVSADFSFTSFSNWERDQSVEPEVFINHGPVENENSSPIVKGTIKNTSVTNIKTLELVVLVMDENENAIGSSRTFIDNLGRGATEDFVFTWQKPFDRKAEVVNVIFRIP